MTISFGLVNVAVKYSPLIDPKGNRVSGKFLDPTTLTPATQQYVNDKGEKVEKVTGYPYGDSFVVLGEGQAQALKSERDGRLELRAFVSPDAVDPLYFEKTNLVSPAKGNESGYDLICRVLADSGRYLVGTTVLDKSTKVVVLRFAQGVLLAHVCTYDANVRWSEKAVVANEYETRDAPAPELVEMAATLFSGLDESFDFSGVEDEYDQRLRAAIEAAGTGKPMPKTEKPAPAVVGDLMEALKASVDAAKKPAKKATAKKKVAA